MFCMPDGGCAQAAIILACIPRKSGHQRKKYIEDAISWFQTQQNTEIETFDMAEICQQLRVSYQTIANVRSARNWSASQPTILNIEGHAYVSMPNSFKAEGIKMTNIIELFEPVAKYSLGHVNVVRNGVVEIISKICKPDFNTRKSSEETLRQISTITGNIWHATDDMIHFDDDEEYERLKKLYPTREQIVRITGLSNFSDRAVTLYEDFKQCNVYTLMSINEWATVFAVDPKYFRKLNQQMEGRQNYAVKRRLELNRNDSGDKKPTNPVEAQERKEQARNERAEAARSLSKKHRGPRTAKVVPVLIGPKNKNKVDGAAKWRENCKKSALKRIKKRENLKEVKPELNSGLPPQETNCAPTYPKTKVRSESRHLTVTTWIESLTPVYLEALELPIAPDYSERSEECLKWIVSLLINDPRNPGLFSLEAPPQGTRLTKFERRALELKISDIPDHMLDERLRPYRRDAEGHRRQSKGRIGFRWSKIFTRSNPLGTHDQVRDGTVRPIAHIDPAPHNTLFDWERGFEDYQTALEN